MNRRYAPTHLSYKKLQNETLCDIQLSSLILLMKRSVVIINKNCICGNPLELLGDLKVTILGNKKNFRLHLKGFKKRAIKSGFILVRTSCPLLIKIIYSFPLRSTALQWERLSKHKYYSLEFSSIFHWDKLY